MQQLVSLCGYCRMIAVFTAPLPVSGIALHTVVELQMHFNGQHLGHSLVEDMVPRYSWKSVQIDRTRQPRGVRDKLIEKKCTRRFSDENRIFSGRLSPVLRFSSLSVRICQYVLVRTYPYAYFENLVEYGANMPEMHQGW